MMLKALKSDYQLLIMSDGVLQFSAKLRAVWVVSP